MWTFIMACLVAVAICVEVVYEWPKSWLRRLKWCPPSFLSTGIAVFITYIAGPIAGALTEIFMYPALKIRYWFLNREDEALVRKTLAEKNKKKLTRKRK